MYTEENIAQWLHRNDDLEWPKIDCGTEFEELTYALFQLMSECVKMPQFHYVLSTIEVYHMYNEIR